MTAPAATPYRSAAAGGGDGFARLVRAEWTKFRTVRGWVVGMLAAAAVTVLIGLVGQAGGGHTEHACPQDGGPPAACGPSAARPPGPPTGPGGEPVDDGLYLVHQTLVGDGTLTARVTSLTGEHADLGAPGGQGQDTPMTPGLVPWAKAGIIVKQSTAQGSAYAAVMVAAGHGVRMQDDYTGDIAGPALSPSASSPVWLRLTRSGETFTGEESTDGTHWTRVGTTTPAGLPEAAQAGMFVSSPDYSVTTTSFGASTDTGPSLATAAFDDVSLRGSGPTGAWTGDDVGGNSPRTGFRQTADGFTVSGSGDIAPVVAGPGGSGDAEPVGNALVGLFAGLIAVLVVAVMFITTEYRRGLIRVTLAASPRRGRVLAAKAVVIGSVAFVAGLVAAAVAVPLFPLIVHANGHTVWPTALPTRIRVIVGTAALVAVAAVFGLAIGTVLRRGATAITAAVVVIVLPYFLVVASVVPPGAAVWLTRLTPAAAFAVQQTLPVYPQVAAAYTPAAGYYPLAPWAGFGVLCGYAAAALALAAYALRRRDA